VARNTDAVWVDVIPSMLEFGSDLAKGAAGAGTKAGTAVAVELEKVVTQAGKQAGQQLGKGIAAAQANVDQMGAALREARRKDEDAAGKVRIAEEKLNEVIAKGDKATGSQRAAAEERLAAARRASASATDNATRATKALEKAEKDAAEATDDVIEATESGGSGLGEYAGQLGGAAKAAAGFAIAAAGVGGGIELISQALAGTDIQATLSAQLGATPQMAAEFGQIAGRLYASNYGASLQNVSEGLRAVLQSGALAEDATSAQIEDITAKALNLQKVFGVDLVKATRAVGVMMRTGMAPDAETAFDIVTRGFQQGVDVAEDYLDTLNEYSTQFRKLGLDGAAATGLLSQGLKAGARDSDVVADALKEFSIRAIDGSTATSAAYKTLGLDATATAQQIARGGSDASGGLQTVLDRLRGIKDPVMQAQAAVGLFGTKAEDLGAALYALDPKTAVDGLGDVAGAAQRMGDTLAASPQAALDTFMRTSQTWAVEVLGGKVIPVLMAVIGWIRDSFVPALSETVQWIQRNQEWLTPLVIALGTFALAYKAVTIATTLWAQRTAIATAAQWAWNVAMTANPIGLIIAGIAALIAAIVWIATQTTWFQDLWAFAWGWIKAIAVATWQVYLKPAFDAIVAALKWVGDAAVWLWQNAFVPAWEAIAAAATWLWSSVLQPVFGFIDGAVRILAAIIITLFVTPAVLAFRLLAGVAMWLWTNAIQPAFDAIAAVATWLYQNVILPVVAGIVAYFRMWAAIATWLWQSVLSPTIDAIAAAAVWLWTSVLSPTIDFIVGAFRAIGDAASWVWSSVLSPTIDALGAAAMWLWQNAIMPAFEAIQAGLRAMGDAFSWVWNSVIQPAWNAFGAGLRWVQESIIRPVFDALKAGVDQVGSAFNSAVDWIGRVWDGLKSKLSGPVNFVINTVYNDGIRMVWNKVAGVVGVGELPYAAPVQFAGGGFVVPGYAPGRDVVPSLLSPGESVLVPELTAAIGPSTIMAANRAASGRRGTVAGGHGVAAFAGGGVVGNLLDWVSGVGDNVARLWKNPIGAIKASIGSSGWADLLARAPAKLITSSAEFLWSKIKGFFGFANDDAARAVGAAGGTPMGWQQMWSIISAQFPGATLNSSFRPGDPGYHGKGRAVDLGGPMDAINRWIAQVYPNSTQLIYTPGANILNGRPFTYDGPTQADHFDHVHWAFDNGGYLPTGVSTVFNGTGRPERILTDQQWDTLASDDPREFRLLSGRLELGEDGFARIIDGRIQAASQATGTAITTRRRI
jgi:phage-related minor tail protein